MKKIRFFQDKRKLKIFAIRAMIYLIIICCIILLSSIIGRADSIPEGYYSSNNVFKVSSYVFPDNSLNLSYTSYTLPFQESNTGGFTYSVSWEFETPVLLSSFFNSHLILSGTQFIPSVFRFYAYDDNDLILYRSTLNSNSTNLLFSTSNSQDGNIYTWNITINSKNVNIRDDPLVSKLYFVFQMSSQTPNKIDYIYSDVPFIPVIPPDPPAPDEWQTLIEFIGYLIDSVVNVFNLTFSIESKLVWALVFGFPILNYVLDFFDEILDQIDASLPADHDLHKYRPDGYTPISYYDNHPYDNYSRWYYEHNGGFHW